MSRRITPASTLDNLKAEAKRWLKALRAGALEARARLARALPEAPAEPTLRDVQHALAREHGFPGWLALKERLATDAPLRRYDRVAEALVAAYQTGAEAPMRIVWEYFGHMRAWNPMRRYVRLELGRTEQPAAGEVDGITLEEARLLVARAQQFESWQALADYSGTLPRGKATIAHKAVVVAAVDSAGAPSEAGRLRDWDEVLTTLRERRLEGLGATGQMTDALLDRVTRLDHLRVLELGGSKELTDDGVRYLARLPRLERLNLSGTGITDAGLEVLRRIPSLRSLTLAWTRITDAGAAHLAGCGQLQAVDLSGTATGDGAIRALAGHSNVRDFRSGNLVTDDGIPLLHEIPVFRSWQGGEPAMSLLGFDAGPNYLLLRGRLTDAGLARMAGLDGLFALNLDSDRLGVTGAGLAPLAALPRLGWLAFDAKDDAMPHIAALPGLRFLLCQDTTAGDDGFVALGRSRTLEYIWARRCHNLRRRGFLALAGMPALRAFSGSCLNVDDEGLAALPRFPALRELMPMDVPDDGYRHIGRCERLEALTLMYCRDTGDVATSHITGLPALRRYFASYNRITDRTPELLSGIASLEEVTFDTCMGLTDAGVAALARLPRLRSVGLSGMPRVTASVAAQFGPGVRVRHTP